MKNFETTVLADGFVFLEGPRWRDGRLWVSDMRAQTVFTVDEAGNREAVVEVPALRQRPEDIAELVEVYLQDLRSQYGRGPLQVDGEALSALQAYDWPGNARELRNVLERLVITARGERVGPEDLPPAMGGTGLDEDPFAGGRSLRDGR